MVLDLDDLPDDHMLHADVCIVGAGAAGIALALDLESSGYDILVLESGSLKPEPKTQALYDGEVSDERMHSPTDRYRQRRFGGSTTVWGGRCMPFDEIDFSTRSYVPYSGWPISLADLLSFYPPANKLCEAGEFKYQARECADLSQTQLIQDFSPENFSADSLERFSCPTDFGKRYLNRFESSSNIRVVLHANLLNIELGDNGTTTESVTVCSLHGKKALARARFFVLATGGLEVPRILLNCRDTQKQGIGNQNDLVGRFYMCHLAGTIGKITFSGTSESVHHGYEMSEEGIYCRRRMSLRPEIQRKHGIGNFVSRLHHPRITDPEHKNSVLSLLYMGRWAIPFEYRQRLYDADPFSMAKFIKHLKNVVTGPHDAAAFCWHMLNDRYLADRKYPSIIVKPKRPVFSLDFHAEQYPNPESRVRLAESVDALNFQKLSVDWRYTSGDIESIASALRLLSKDIEKSAVGEFEYDPQTIESEATRYGAYGGHHMGTTRMGSNPRNSVVDSNCKIHSTTNLYVAGSSVFPTSSQATPTLTIVAMSLRLSNHLANKLSHTS